MRFAPGDAHASWSAQYLWCTGAIESVLAPSWSGTPCSSCVFGNIVLLKVALQGWFCCLSGCLFTFFKSDESSFVGFGCVVIFISFQVLSLFLLARLFVLKVLFVLGIDVWERFVSFPWVVKAPGIFIVLMNCHHPWAPDWQLGRLASCGHLDLHTCRRWRGLTTLRQSSFGHHWDLFPACVCLTPQDCPECFAFTYNSAQTGWLVASTGQQPSQQVSLALKSVPHQLPAALLEKTQQYKTSWTHLFLKTLMWHRVGKAYLKNRFLFGVNGWGLWKYQPRLGKCLFSLL